MNCSLNQFCMKCNRVNSKEELLLLLKQYRGILSDSIVEYLYSLIELEFSVVREYISNEDRKVLSELEIYKKIAIYNIYNRALNLFQQEDIDFSICGNEEENEGLSVSFLFHEKFINLFDFNYREGPIEYEYKIPVGYKTMKIGTIQLYETIENKDLREVELNRVMEELKTLYDTRNPYPSYSNSHVGTRAMWKFEHSQKISQYEKKLTELDSKKNLSDEDKKEIEITKYIHELLMNDYGLTNESFEEESSPSFESYDKKKTKLQKTFVKKLPNMKIENRIKYI